MADYELYADPLFREDPAVVEARQAESNKKMWIGITVVVVILVIVGVVLLAVYAGGSSDDDKCPENADLIDGVCTCRQGYELRGDGTCRSVGCSKDGIGLPCGGPARGTCAQYDNGDNYCQCNAGYTGNFCEENDECGTIGRCVNGVCDENNDGCICEPGWGGVNCDFFIGCQDDAECGGNEGRGTCGPGGVCQCNPGFEEPDCHPPTGVCDPNPCQNGGTCQVDPDNPAAFQCFCPPGVQGTTCDVDASQCLEFVSVGPDPHWCFDIGRQDPLQSVNVVPGQGVGNAPEQCPQLENSLAYYAENDPGNQTCEFAQCPPGQVFDVDEQGAVCRVLKPTTVPQYNPSSYANDSLILLVDNRLPLNARFVVSDGSGGPLLQSTTVGGNERPFPEGMSCVASMAGSDMETTRCNDFVLSAFNLQAGTGRPRTGGVVWTFDSDKDEYDLNMEIATAPAQRWTNPSTGNKEWVSFRVRIVGHRPEVVGSPLVRQWFFTEAPERPAGRPFSFPAANDEDTSHPFQVKVDYYLTDATIEGPARLRLVLYSLSLVNPTPRPTVLK